MVFKFRDDWRKSRAKSYGYEEFNRMETQGYFSDSEWKMLTEKYNAKSIGKGEIEITLESFKDLNQFLADIHVTDVEYVPYKCIFVHRIPETW